MTRDEIYDHLAQVYLGKRRTSESQKKKKITAWLVINVVITAVIFLSVFYGLTAFLVRRGASFKNAVFFSVHQGPITLEYNFKDSPASEKMFSLSIPTDVDVSRYGALTFSIRGREEGSPGVVKVSIHNQKNEQAVYYVRDVGRRWQAVTVPFDRLSAITDWSQVEDVSFSVEGWNVESKKGVVLIEDVRFASEKGADGV